MIQLFALSIINVINSYLPEDTEVFLKPDVDAQNAVVFEHADGIIYYQISADLETNKFVLTEIYLDKNYNMEFENSDNYDTIAFVLSHIVSHIRKLKGL